MILSPRGILSTKPQSICSILALILIEDHVQDFLLLNTLLICQIVATSGTFLDVHTYVVPSFDVLALF